MPLDAKERDHSTRWIIGICVQKHRRVRIVEWVQLVLGRPLALWCDGRKWSLGTSMLRPSGVIVRSIRNQSSSDSCLLYTLQIAHGGVLINLSTVTSRSLWQFSLSVLPIWPGRLKCLATEVSVSPLAIVL